MECRARVGVSAGGLDVTDCMANARRQASALAARIMKRMITGDAPRYAIFRMRIVTNAAITTKNNRLIIDMRMKA